jgi:hypothetical protein
MASSSRSIRFDIFNGATVIRLRPSYGGGGRVANGYSCVRGQTKASLKKAARTTSFRRVGWNFSAALWAKSE